MFALVSHYLPIGDWHDAGIDRHLSHTATERLTWLTKAGLSNGMVEWVEVKVYHSADRGNEGCRIEVQAFLTNVDINDPACVSGCKN
jgi:hypothetical protein